MSSNKEKASEVFETHHHSTFGSDIVDTQSDGISFSALIDRNSWINILLLCISIYGAFFSEKYYFLAFTWICFLLLEDLLFFGFGISIFDTEIGIKRGYQFGHVFLHDISGHGRDLGFNLYNGNLEQSLKETQVAKYEYLIKELGLKKGMRLLDCGCGYGDWLYYAKNKVGVDAIGINITPEQANYARNHYGLKIYNINWKDVLTSEKLQKELYGTFDCITYMDTVEHYVSGKDRRDVNKRQIIYSNLFMMSDKLLNPNSSIQRVFISCLHQNIKNIRWNFKARVSAYLLTRYHSGYYPIDKDGLTKHAKKWFKTIKQTDQTEDYRLTAVLDTKQFQAPTVPINFKKICYAIFLFIVDPHHIHRWLDIYFDAWMNLYGDDVYSKEYNPQKRRETSRVILWWITLQNKRIQ